MFRRRKSAGERVLGLLPVLALVGLGIASVIVAMNLLVTVTPVALGVTPSPSPTASGPSFAPVRSYPIATDPPPTAVPIVAVPSTRPVVLDKRLAEHDPRGIWDVSIAYPAFQGSSTPWAADINDTIESVERMQADKFEQGPAGTRQQAGKTNRLQGNFVTELLTPRIAAFTLTWVDDTVPGHLAIIVSTLNLDLATGQPIAFDDMFTDPETALQLLSTQASDMLYVQLGAQWDQTAADLGLAPTHANFGNWALTANGLKVTFDQFQVVGGDRTPSVLVPWSALTAVMAGTGPVAELIGLSQPSPGPSGLPAASGSPAAQLSPSPAAPSATPTPNSTDPTGS